MYSDSLISVRGSCASSFRTPKTGKSLIQSFGRDYHYNFFKPQHEKGPHELCLTTHITPDLPFSISTVIAIASTSGVQEIVSLQELRIRVLPYTFMNVWSKRFNFQTEE